MKIFVAKNPKTFHVAWESSAVAGQIFPCFFTVPNASTERFADMGFPVCRSFFWEWSFAGIVLLFFLASILITPLLVIDCQIVKSKRSGVVFVDFLLCCSLFS